MSVMRRTTGQFREGTLKAHLAIATNAARKTSIVLRLWNTITTEIALDRVGSNPPNPGADG